MFILTTIVDIIRIPAHMMASSTLTSLHSEIDEKYPDRVLMDVGLVICRFGDCLKITNGLCVPGDGGSHHECLFKLVVFRPFVEEVCLGRIVKSDADGIQVSVGFFQDIFIPAYWMLRPSHYDEKVGLWVWTPKYDEDDDEEEEGVEDDNGEDAKPSQTDDPLGDTEIKVKEESSEQGTPSQEETEKEQEEQETETRQEKQETSLEETETKQEGEIDKESKAEEGGDRFEMEIGAEIRFKVKSIHFTQVTNTAKGVQATTTTTAHSHSFPTKEEETTLDQPLRKRSTSVDLSDVSNMPASMHIVASICEDGLGCTSWWTSQQEDGEVEVAGEGEEVGEGEGDEVYEEVYE
jgi:DNA-directed RNA polymerase III subunit RPC8